MKLNESYKDRPRLLNIEDEGLEIYQAAKKAYLSGDLERGWHLASQLNPRDEGRLFYSAYVLGSQLNAFRLKLGEATRIARKLFDAMPEVPGAAYHLVLALTYERKIDEAWELQEWIARNYPDELNHHQNACLLAARGQYALALHSMRESLLRSSRESWNKVWYDPELFEIWQHAARPDPEPALIAELRHPVWQDLVRTFDAQAPFKLIDPGNLLGYDTDQLSLIAYNPDNTLGYLMDEDAILDPVAYAKTFNQLSEMRHTSFTRLKLVMSYLDSLRWHNAYKDLEASDD